MTVTNYIRQKNALVHAVTGLTLVPEEQIKDVTALPLNSKMFSRLTSGSCPYCTVYESECTGCPIEEADNACILPNEDTNTNSTWYKADLAWQTNATPKDHKALADLVAKFNEQFEEA